MDNESKILIEQMIDTYGLTAVVDTIIRICYDKAEHIRSNYQDFVLAKTWEKSGVSLANPKEPTEFPS